MFFEVVLLDRRLRAWTSPRYATKCRALIAAGVAVQATIVFARGGMVQPQDYLSHSYAAKLALRRAPRLHNPSFEIFASRTTGGASLEGPIVYRDGDRCRKALASREQAQELERLCGAIPAAQSAFFAARGPEDERTYVDY